MKEDLQQHFSFDGDRICVINNPIDIETAQRKSVAFVPFTPTQKTLVFVGRLSAVKQIEHILKALTLEPLTDVALHVIGDGDQRATLEARATELQLNDRVIFHGAQSNPYAYIKQADAMVLTSVYEGFPNVLVEAIAVGTPICSYNSPGGAREIVCAENGFLVEPCTPEALATAVHTLLGNPPKAKAVQHTATRFRKETIVAQYTALFST
jgi:glycosyltransferase involved in cell wall biosynthesis